MGRCQGHLEPSRRREPNGWDGPGEDYCCINWNAVRGPIGEWNDVEVTGTSGYDGGAKDGPYVSIFESSDVPSL